MDPLNTLGDISLSICTMTDISTICAGDFEPLLHRSLFIRFTPEVSWSAELIEVSQHSAHSDALRQPFSIILRTTQKNEYFAQAIFEVEHPTLGILPLFLVPIGPDSEGMRYQAIFS